MHKSAHPTRAAAPRRGRASLVAIAAVLCSLIIAPTAASADPLSDEPDGVAAAEEAAAPVATSVVISGDDQVIEPGHQSALLGIQVLDQFAEPIADYTLQLLLLAGVGGTLNGITLSGAPADSPIELFETTDETGWAYAIIDVAPGTAPGPFSMVAIGGDVSGSWDNLSVAAQPIEEEEAPGPPTKITETGPLTFAVNTEVSIAFSADGVPAPTISVEGEYPPGLKWDPVNNRLYGQVTAADIYYVIVVAENASGNTEKAFEINVTEPDDAQQQPSPPATDAPRALAATGSEAPVAPVAAALMLIVAGAALVGLRRRSHG